MDGISLAWSVRDAAPGSIQTFLPEADFIVAAGDREHVPGHAPAEMPHDVLEGVEGLGGPGAGRTPVAAPDDDATILEEKRKEKVFTDRVMCAEKKSK